jgi:hypothetical protein
VEFMSEDHVATMNALLHAAPTVRSECAKLDRPYVIAYELLEGPAGETLHWHVAFEETVQFGLVGHPAPDVIVTMAWRDMVLSSAAGRRGEEHDTDAVVDGDQDALVLTAPAFAAARAVATVPLTFPTV